MRYMPRRTRGPTPLRVSGEAHRRHTAPAHPARDPRCPISQFYSRQTSRLSLPLRSTQRLHRTSTYPDRTADGTGGERREEYNNVNKSPKNMKAPSPAERGPHLGKAPLPRWSTHTARTRHDTRYIPRAGTHEHVIVLGVSLHHHIPSADTVSQRRRTARGATIARRFACAHTASLSTEQHLDVLHSQTPEHHIELDLENTDML